MKDNIKMVPALLFAAALLTGAATADAQTVAGKWEAEYPTRVRQEAGGTPHAEEMGKATLTLQVKGDSVFGEWHALNTPSPSKPRTVKGTFSNGRINFVSSPTEATIRRSTNAGDDEQKIMMITYFEGTVKEGAIEGLMHSESEDQTIKSHQIKWTAKLAGN